jgi:hypothetical protein
MPKRKLTEVAIPCPAWSKFVQEAVTRRQSAPMIEALERGSSWFYKLPNGAIQWHWRSGYSCDLMLIQEGSPSLAAVFRDITGCHLDSLVLWRGRRLLKIIDCKEAK